MIEELKPYEALRPSGDPWLGAIPKHWSQKRLWSMSSPRVERNPGNLPLLSVFLDRGVIPYGAGGGQVHAPSLDLSSYQVVHPGDFVLNNQQAWRGSVGVSRHHGIISPAYIVLRLNGELLPAYANYLFRCPRLVDQFVAASKGVGDIQRQVFWPFLRRVIVPIPSTTEQEAIVRFLDHANRRIDQFIRSKKKLIALLNEQKQAIIHRAVTRGLDPTVKMKDSGVPWLGEIPAHWEVRRFRYLLRERLAYGANAAAEFDNPSWPRYIRITDFRSDGTLKPDTFRSLPPSIAADYLVQSGDILLARSGATVGKAFLVSGLESDACHAGYLIRARVKTNLILPEFAFAFTQTRAFGQWKDITLNTTTIQNIAADKYADLPVPVPPIREQMALLAAVESEVAPIRIAELRVEREIASIRDYRTRLVADVVTGQLDVRTAAAALPAVEPEAAPTESEHDETDIEDDEAA